MSKNKTKKQEGGQPVPKLDQSEHTGAQESAGDQQGAQTSALNESSSTEQSGEQQSQEPPAGQEGSEDTHDRAESSSADPSEHTGAQEPPARLEGSEEPHAESSSTGQAGARQTDETNPPAGDSAEDLLQLAQKDPAGVNARSATQNTAATEAAREEASGDVGDKSDRAAAVVGNFSALYGGEKQTESPAEVSSLEGEEEPFLGATVEVLLVDHAKRYHAWGAATAGNSKILNARAAEIYGDRLVRVGPYQA